MTRIAPGVRTPNLYSRRDYGRPGVDYAYPVGVEPSRELIATATIALTKKRPAGAEDVFNAATVRDTLRVEMLAPGR